MQISNPVPNQQNSEIQLPPKAKGKHFSKSDKLNLLMQIDACKPGEQGHFLRKHGIYSSALARWREQRANGQLNEPGQGTNDYWQQRAEALSIELAQAHSIIAAQKKLAEVFGMLALSCKEIK